MFDFLHIKCVSEMCGAYQLHFQSFKKCAVHTFVSPCFRIAIKLMFRKYQKCVTSLMKLRKIKKELVEKELLILH